MYKGLALQAKQKWPEMFKTYKSFCEGACPSYPNGLEPGGMVCIEHVPNKYITCLATKDDWRNPSKLEWVETGLKQLVVFSMQVNRCHITIPRLGCGSGGLDWCEVKPVVERVFNNTPITVDIYNKY